MGKWMYNPVVHTGDERYDFCPFCKSPMRVEILPQVQKSTLYYIPQRIAFVCDECGTQGPTVSIEPDLIDVNEVRLRIEEKLIDIDAKKIEEGEE